MGYYRFDKDIKIAKETENEIVDILKNRYNNFVFKSFNNDIYYDIECKIDGTTYFIEVKEDFYCKKSGNIALEYSCRNKPSGIYNTKANLQIYKIHDINFIVYLLFCHKRLKFLIDKKLFIKKVTGGDKGSNTKMFLFKKNIFYKYANDVLYLKRYGEKF